jgi:hypothetical protein
VAELLEFVVVLLQTDPIREDNIDPAGANRLQSGPRARLGRFFIPRTYLVGLAVAATADGDPNWWYGKVKGRTPTATILRPTIPIATVVRPIIPIASIVGR